MPGADPCWLLRKYFNFALWITGSALTVDEAESSPGSSHVVAAGITIWYRSITKQFFRKADGVVVVYDVTNEQTFTAVRHWLASVQEGAGEDIPIMLLGNKTDLDGQREVPLGVAEKLAKDFQLIFYECSAFSSHNVTESMIHMARVLKDQEDREKEKTVSLLDSHAKKKSCC